MMRHRYTAWDGSQRVRLDPDRLFEQLAGYLGASDDLGEALDRLLADGHDGAGFEVIGIDELLSRVREARQELYDTFNLDHALDRHQEALDDLVDDENEALDGRRHDGGEADVRRRESMARVPRALDAAIAHLSGHDFTSAQAAAAFERLSLDGEDVGRLARFIRSHGELFHGKTGLGFDDALDLLGRVEALERLEQQLQSRELDAIDAAAADELVGVGFGDAVANLGEMFSLLVDAGYIRPRGEAMVLSPRGARKLGQLALREIHEGLRYDSTGRHGTEVRGTMEISAETARRYHYGDPMHINVGASVINAVKRGGGVPIELEPGDLEVCEATFSSRAATVLLLDMSWSMSWEGRFAAAKKVALAMDCLMRARFPQDYFAIVGFYTRAVELRFQDLPEATWNMGDPFTNLQDGLRMASELLMRQPGTNKSMVVVTDGQPTAYHAGGKLYCEWPMSLGGLSTRATAETLKEVGRVTRRGITINTFMLDDSPPLRAFVEKMTAINKGRAFYTSPGELGRFLLVDYVNRRRKVI